MKNIVSSLPSPGAAPTVLVIDQQRNLPEAVFAALDQGGYAVRRYRNARQALREFGREPADLVLVDLPLPDDGAGLGVLAELRQLSAVPVVLLARQPRLDDITDSFLLGADDYIQIPIDPARLIER